MVGTDFVIEIASRPTFFTGIANSRERSDDDEKNNMHFIIWIDQ